MINSKQVRDAHTAIAKKLVYIFQTSPLVQQNVFKPVEISALERSIKEDLTITENNWLQRILSCVVDEGTCLSLKQLQVFREVQASGLVGKNSEISEKKAVLEQKLDSLRRQQARMKSRAEKTSKKQAPMLPSHKVLEIELNDLSQKLLTTSNDRKVAATASEEILEALESLISILPPPTKNYEDLLLDLLLASNAINDCDSFRRAAEQLSNTTDRQLACQRNKLMKLRSCLLQVVSFYETRDQSWIGEMTNLVNELPPVHTELHRMSRASDALMLLPAKLDTVDLGEAADLNGMRSKFAEKSQEARELYHRFDAKLQQK